MPLTPRFSLRQTPTHVYVEISVPSFRLSAGTDGGMEVVLMGEHNSEFHFYAKPYLLKLNFFPHGFVDQDIGCESTGETGVGTAKYDPSEQTVAVPLLKLRPSQNNNDDDNENENEDTNHWPDLELTARMIQPKEIPKKWLHAVVDESENENGEANGSANGGNDEGSEQQDDDGGADVYIENQAVADATNQNLLAPNLQNSGDGYGFSSMFRNIFTDYCRSGLAEEMLQLQLDPEHSTMDERRDARSEHESRNFDFERYLADLELCEDSTDDYLYPMVMSYQPWWRKSLSSSKSQSKSTATSKTTTTASLTEDLDQLAIHNDSNSNSNSNINSKKNNNNKEDNVIEKAHGDSETIFSDDEKLLLSTIPYPLLPKSLLANDRPKQRYRLWCGLLELVFAYVYEHLATMGESTVESAWTITVLAPGLSWLDSSPSNSVEKTTKAFVRRLLVYPYWRNAEGLGKKVLVESLALIRTHGIRGITKALLQIRAILDKSEVHYMGNKLLIDPYLYWIQNLHHSKISSSGSGGGGGGLDRIVSELSEIVRDDKNFGKLVTSVEASLGIDAMMEEYFGDEDEDDAAATSESESSSSNASDGDGDSDGDVHKNENERGENMAATVQLLDDEVGHGIIDAKDNHGARGQLSSMLYCLEDEPRSASTTDRPLITEVRSETKGDSKNLLIQEL